MHTHLLRTLSSSHVIKTKTAYTVKTQVVLKKDKFYFNTSD